MIGRVVGGRFDLIGRVAVTSEFPKVCRSLLIFVCSVCTGNWRIFNMYVMCANTDVTFLYVFPINYYIVASVCCTVLVPKSQCMQQLVYNFGHSQTSVSLEVQFLALCVIENL